MQPMMGYSEPNWTCNYVDDHASYRYCQLSRLTGVVMIYQYWEIIPIHEMGIPIVRQYKGTTGGWNSAFLTFAKMDMTLGKSGIKLKQMLEAANKRDHWEIPPQGLRLSHTDGD